MKRLFIIAALACAHVAAQAWDGVDLESGGQIEIEAGELVREGEDVEIFDYERGGYRTIEVDSIRRYGSQVEIEAIDYETGEIRTFEMDDQ